MAIIVKYFLFVDVNYVRNIMIHGPLELQAQCLAER